MTTTKDNILQYQNTLDMSHLAKISSAQCVFKFNVFGILFWIKRAFYNKVELEGARRETYTSYLSHTICLRLAYIKPRPILYLNRRCPSST